MQERKEGGDRAEAQQESKHNTIGKRFKAESEARTRTIASNPRLRGSERAGGRGRGQRTIGSVVVQVSFHFTRGEREGKYGEDRRDRENRRIRAGDRFSFAPSSDLFLRRPSPPIDFPMSSVKGVESEGEIEIERERRVQPDRKRGEGGRARSRSKGRSVIPRVPPANSNNRESSSIATGPDRR